MDFTRKVVIGVSISALGIVILLFMWKVSSILLLAFAGVLLGVLLRGLAKLVAVRTPLSTQASLYLVLAVFIAAAAAAVVFGGPRIASQVDQAAQSFPAIMAQAQEQLGSYGWGRYLIEQMRALEPGGERIISSARSVVASVAWAVTGILVVLFVGLYTAIAPRPYWNGVLALVPKRHERKARQVRDEIETQLQRWLTGRLIAMSVVGVLTVIGLLFLDVPLAFTLGIIAALFDFIPNIGPIIAAVPAVLLAISTSPQLALYVIILYTAIQLIENYIVSPVVERRAVHLAPGFILVFQLAMGSVFGFLGLFLATPIAVVLIILVKNFYIES